MAKRSPFSATDEHLLRVRRLVAFRRMLGTPRSGAYKDWSACRLRRNHCIASQSVNNGRSLNNGPRWRAAASSCCLRITNYAIGLSNDRLQFAIDEAQSCDDKDLSFYIALQWAAQNVNKIAQWNCMYADSNKSSKSTARSHTKRSSIAMNYRQIEIYISGVLGITIINWKLLQKSLTFSRSSLYWS